MSQVDLVPIAAASINTPAAGILSVFVDTDLKLKMKDANGVLSILNNDGLHDKNSIVNGSFRVQQRVATAATAIPSVSLTTRAGQVADRWAVTIGNVTTPLWTQVDSATAPETGLVSKFYGKITQNTNAAKFILSQFIENERMAHLRGKKVRLSCKIKQFVGSNAVYRLGLLQLTNAGTVDVCPAFISAIGGASVEPTWGTNLAAITPDAAPTGENGTISGVALSITSTAAWVRSSAVFSVPSTALNLCVVLYRDTIGAASDVVGIAEFQMTEGADIVEWVTFPYAVELLKCQRFFAKSFPQITVPVASAITNGATMGIIGKAAATALAAKLFPVWPVVMFKTPTLVLFTPTAAGAVPFRIDGTTPAAQTAVAQSLVSDRGAFVSATGDANGAVGDMVAVHWTAEAEFIT
jgi:hypothetical protein